MNDETVGVEIVEHPVHIGYGLSRDGRVWSRRNRTGMGKGSGRGTRSILTDTWRLLKPGQGRKGRLQFMACDGHGRIKCVPVHVAVIETFTGPRPAGFYACHNDGNHLNNHISNLRWDTPTGNNRDKVLHGTDQRGENHGAAILTIHQVHEIRNLHANGGVSKAELGRRFGVHETTIGHVILRRSWKHI